MILASEARLEKMIQFLPGSLSFRMLAPGDWPCCEEYQVTWRGFVQVFGQQSQLRSQQTASISCQTTERYFMGIWTRMAPAINKNTVANIESKLAVTGGEG